MEYVFAAAVAEFTPAYPRVVCVSVSTWNRYAATMAGMYCISPDESPLWQAGSLQPSAGKRMREAQKMWEDLWKDFNDRAERLNRDPVQPDAVDQAILWQLNGTEPFIGNPPQAIPFNQLQLPELYSGNPGQDGAPYIVYVTINPSVSATEAFPTRETLAQHGVSGTLPFFQDRFCTKLSDIPVRHGRHKGRPVTWGTDGRPRGQRTWTSLENALREYLPQNHPCRAHPLGHAAALIDAVPWKFANWAKVPNDLKNEFIERGRPYLKRTLEYFCRKQIPRAVIVCGMDARKAMNAAFPEDVPAYGPQEAGHGELNISGNTIPWFGVSAPTAFGGRFRREMAEIGNALTDLLQD